MIEGREIGPLREKRSLWAIDGMLMSDDAEWWLDLMEGEVRVQPLRGRYQRTDRRQCAVGHLFAAGASSE